MIYLIRLPVLTWAPCTIHKAARRKEVRRRRAPQQKGARETSMSGVDSRGKDGRYRLKEVESG
jgi:hypothetical protein